MDQPEVPLEQTQEDLVHHAAQFRREMGVGRGVDRRAFGRVCRHHVLDRGTSRRGSNAPRNPIFRSVELLSSRRH